MNLWQTLFIPAFSWYNRLGVVVLLYRKTKPRLEKAANGHPFSESIVIMVYPEKIAPVLSSLTFWGYIYCFLVSSVLKGGNHGL